MSRNNKTYRAPSHEEIAACAQIIYERQGRPEGKALEHWLQAEAQLIADRKAEAGIAVAKTPPMLPAPAKPRATAPKVPSWAPPQRQTLRGQ